MISSQSVSGDSGKIQIVGGGLAGLSLGILLRQQGVPVAVFEAGTYPRHRVCGEFICGEGLRVLGEAGAINRLLDMGARWCSSAAFLRGSRSSGVWRLPKKAFCVSRYTLDAVLAGILADLGGELLTDTRYTRPVNSPGTVRASGRVLQKGAEARQWIGLKAHLRGAPGIDHLQMHRTRHGYVGVSPIENGGLNVCGLFNLAQVRNRPADLHATFLGGESGSALHHLVHSGDLDPSTFCSVSGFTLEPALHSGPDDEFRIGDAASMIPPFTGNGMSIAFESAAGAASVLASFSRGEISWEEALVRHRGDMNRGLRRRLSWASRLHQLMFLPVAGDRLFVDIPRIPPLRHALFNLTR